MLRRYAVAHAVYKARQRDEVRPCLVSNNQTFGYLHLILWWSASAGKTHQRFGKRLSQLVTEVKNKSTGIASSSTTTTRRFVLLSTQAHADDSSSHRGYRHQ